MSGGLLDQVTCARCIGKVDPRAPTIACDRCGQEYPRAGRIPVLLPRPDAHVALWRQQLTFVTMQGRRTLAGLEEQAAAEGLLLDTRARLLALAQGVRDQTEEIATLVGPAIGGPVPASESVPLPRGADAPIQYLHYLYRDWGWEGEGEDENQTALEAGRGGIDPAPLGPMLGLGGGAGRLP